MKTRAVNLYGAPGSGKSTAAACIFSRLRLRGCPCELVTEFAKELVWEERAQALRNQTYVLGSQYQQMERCAGRGSVLITDSPLLLSAFYNTDPEIQPALRGLAMILSGKFQNFDFFLTRAVPYVQEGRIHTQEQSDRIEQRMEEFLQGCGIVPVRVPGSEAGYEEILRTVQDALSI